MTNDPLDGLTIPVPCTEPWETMTGDERRRLCAKCRLHVHDLSAMTRGEAIAFLGASSGGRACVRFTRRPDGRVLTSDCRVAIRQLRRRALLGAAALVGALGLGGAALAIAVRAENDGGWSNPDVWDRQPFATIAKVLPASWLPHRRMVLMGEVAAPPPPAAGASGGR